MTNQTGPVPIHDGSVDVENLISCAVFLRVSDLVKSKAGDLLDVLHAKRSKNRRELDDEFRVLLLSLSHFHDLEILGEVSRPFDEWFSLILGDDFIRFLPHEVAPQGGVLKEFFGNGREAVLILPDDLKRTGVLVVSDERCHLTKKAVALQEKERRLFAAVDRTGLGIFIAVEHFDELISRPAGMISAVRFSFRAWHLNGFRPRVIESEECHDGLDLRRAGADIQKPLRFRMGIIRAGKGVLYGGQLLILLRFGDAASEDLDRDIGCDTRDTSRVAVHLVFLLFHVFREEEDDFVCRIMTKDV